VIRFGALFVGVALAAEWLAGYTETPELTIGSLAALTLGLVLLLAGREPWPSCCEHCPVYAQRRADAVDDHDRPAAFEAKAIIAAARAEREAAVLDDWEAGREAREHTDPRGWPYVDRDAERG
jgi:hypothetical protein